MKITRISPLTGIEHTMDLDISTDQLQRYNNGELIQNVLSHLSDDEREFIISGCTPEDFNTLFPEDEENYDDDEPAF